MTLNMCVTSLLMTSVTGDGHFPWTYSLSGHPPSETTTRAYSPTYLLTDRIFPSAIDNCKAEREMSEGICPGKYARREYVQREMSYTQRNVNQWQRNRADSLLLRSSCSMPSPLRNGFL